MGWNYSYKWEGVLWREFFGRSSLEGVLWKEFFGRSSLEGSSLEEAYGYLP
jgi:hypothetical protein